MWVEGLGLIYVIKEIARETSAGHTYVLVDFWQTRAQFDGGRPPTLTNDFIMAALFPDTARTQIDGNIRAYWRAASANHWTGDHTADTTKKFRRKGLVVRQKVTAPITRDTTDNGIIERQDVKDSVGEERE